MSAINLLPFHTAYSKMKSLKRIVYLAALKRSSLTLFAATFTVLLTGCAGPGSLPGSAGQLPAANDSGARASICKSTDTQIDNASQCLLDDAACYQLSNGKWCTGVRGNTCPTGSVALPAGQPCPPGKRCFRVAESLECTIS